MKHKFRSINLHQASMLKLSMIDKIIQEYLADGYKLTVRQLFYQMVGRGLIENDQKEYRKISSLVVLGRMGGLIDFNAIEDRVRIPRLPYFCENPRDAIEDTILTYRIDRQDGQEWYTEVWSEKDALSGLLYDVTRKYHVNLVINRGYSSCSAMYEAYGRFAKAITENGQLGQIIYLGDHDPSGKDMIRDIQDRMNEFGIGKYIDVIPVALTMEQIEKYDPPPYFAKIKDPRAKWYMAEFGDVAWEVDALTPQVLKKVLEDAITDRMDLNLYMGRLEQEEKDIKELNGLGDLDRGNSGGSIWGSRERFY